MRLIVCLTVILSVVLSGCDVKASCCDVGSGFSCIEFSPFLFFQFQNENRGFVDGDENQRRFVYFTKNLPRFLRKQPSGNLFRAQILGMELIELSNNEYNDLFGGDSVH